MPAEAPAPPAPSRRGVSARRLLLPSEHGSWALAFEPVVLGLLVAPSGGGACIAGAVAAGFFARKPARLGWGRLASKDAAVRRAARRAALLLGTMAAGFVAGAAALAGAHVLLPFVAVVPGAAFFAWCDRSGRVRSLAAEMTGAAMCALPLAAMALAAGKTFAPAFSLAALAAARSLPTITLVRALLRGGDGGSFPSAFAWQAVALLGIGALWRAAWLPLGAVFVTLALAARAMVYFSLAKNAPTAKQIGITETFVGAAWIVFLSAIFA